MPRVASLNTPSFRGEKRRSFGALHFYQHCNSLELVGLLSLVHSMVSAIYDGGRISFVPLKLYYSR